MTHAQFETSPVRDKPAGADGILKAEYLPSFEVILAAKLIQQENGTTPRDDLVTTIMRSLGVKRAGPKLFTHINKILTEAELSTLLWLGFHVVRLPL